MHTDADAALHLPAGHCLAAPDPESVVPARQNDPAGQGACVPTVELAAHTEPAKHKPEQLDDVRPVVLPKRPAGQAVIDEDPAGQKLPTVQAVAEH